MKHSDFNNELDVVAWEYKRCLDFVGYAAERLPRGTALVRLYFALKNCGVKLTLSVIAKDMITDAKKITSEIYVC